MLLLHSYVNSPSPYGQPKPIAVLRWFIWVLIPLTSLVAFFGRCRGTLIRQKQDMLNSRFTPGLATNIAMLAYQTNIVFYALFRDVLSWSVYDGNFKELLHSTWTEQSSSLSQDFRNTPPSTELVKRLFMTLEPGSTRINIRALLSILLLQTNNSRFLRVWIIESAHVPHELYLTLANAASSHCIKQALVFCLIDIRPASSTCNNSGSGKLIRTSICKLQQPCQLGKGRPVRDLIQ